MRSISSLALLAITLSVSALADEPAALSIANPSPYSVTQRQGFDPKRDDEPGAARIAVRGAWTGAGEGLTAEYRAAPMKDGFGADVDWTPVDVRFDDGPFELSPNVPAGGWYRLEVRLIRDGKAIAQGAVEPIGVGEVFVIAGQSYAANSNDERLQVSSKGKPVSVYDPARDVWRIADDPQPTPDSSDAGSIWPAFGDVLAEKLQVPIGMVNVAYGGTSTAQWAPGGDLHGNLIEAGREIGQFRAVLWQQGESDVIGKTSTEDYVKNVVAIREAAAEKWTASPKWLLAKSTLHPTVYDDPEGRDRIRKAIDLLSEKPGFRLGPDTDMLDGENRGGPDSRRHFSAIGQRRAAQMWCDAVTSEMATAK